MLISADDLARLGLRDRRRACVLALRAGVFRGRLRIAPIKPGNLEVHWPEGNVLLAGARTIRPRSSRTTTPSSRSRRPTLERAPGLPEPRLQSMLTNFGH